MTDSKMYILSQQTDLVGQCCKIGFVAHILTSCIAYAPIQFVPAAVAKILQSTIIVAVIEKQDVEVIFLGCAQPIRVTGFSVKDRKYFQQVRSLLKL